MPIWGWVCVGLTVFAVVMFVSGYVSGVRKRKYTLEKGDHTIGWIVQANNDLFTDGVLDLPALVLVSPDKATAEDGEYMTQLANRIGRLKGIGGDNDDEEFVSKLVTDETYREGKRDKLPPRFADGRDVYLAQILVCRDDLPWKHLKDPFVHCAIVWEEPGTLICTRPAPPAPPREKRAGR